MSASVIHSTFGYNLAHLYDKQIQAKSSDLLKMVNDISLLGSTSRLRILQLQLLEWLPTSPLSEWPYSDTNIFKDWWSSLLSAAKQTGLQFQQCLDSDYYLKEIDGGSLPLIKLLPSKMYRQNIMKLRSLSLLYVDQLTTMDGSYLFTAFDLNMIFDSVFHSAKWFKQLESQLLTNNTERLLSSRCPPHPSIVKAPTHLPNLEASPTNPKFVVI